MNPPRPLLKVGDRVGLDIEDLAFGGRGVARLQGFVVFVEGALAGEAVTGRVRRVRPGFAEAECVEIRRPSTERVTPPCPHYGACGGCDLQHLSRAGQAGAKRLQVAALLSRIGGMSAPSVLPAILPGGGLGYRFRMDFDWGKGPGGRPILGLHRRGRPAEILPLETCLLPPEPAPRIRELAERRAVDRGLQAWDPGRRTGLLRRLGIQVAPGTREILLTLQTSRGRPDALEGLAGDLVRAFPRLVGVVRQELDRDDRPVEESILFGRDHLFEEVEGDRFRIPSDAFFQPNSAGWKDLRQTVLAALAPRPGDRFLELFSGVGFFTLPAARLCEEVLAWEGARAAAEAARVNVAHAGLGNVRIECRGVDASLADTLAGGRFDRILLDPPRGGVDARAAQALAGAQARRLVYVSCDPATLARDLRLLLAGGTWSLREVTPIDLFPQTHHIECVATLEGGRASPGS